MAKSYSSESAQQIGTERFEVIDWRGTLGQTKVPEKHRQPMQAIAEESLFQTPPLPAENTALKQRK